MAFVGSLSSSIGSTTIAVTGSLVPGSDNFNDLGTSGNKWKTVFSNNITGSLTRLAGGGEYLKPGSNVTLTTGSDGSVTIAAAGAGGGAGVFTESGASAAFTTSSIAIGFGAAASTKGSDVFFAVSGSNTSSNTALFSGPIVTSGSFAVKDLANGNTVASITGVGVISGSGLQTVGNLAVQGTSALTGDVTFGGNIVADANEPKSIFALVTSNPITVGGAGSSVDVAGTLKVSGNQISGSAGGNLQLGAAGNVAVAGDLTVLGNDIVFAAAAGNIATAATSLNVGGTSTTTLTLGGAASKVVVAGDFEVQGTTMTVSASNLVIEDPLIGFGFLTGSLPGSSTGDRGFVGGYTGGGDSNVAFGYSLANTAFVATKTNSDATATTFAVNDLQPIRASKFQISGSTAEVKGNGSTLQLSGTQLDVFAGDTGVSLFRDGTSFLQLLSSSYTSGGGAAGNVARLGGGPGQGILLAPASGKKIHLSGSIELGGGVDNSVNFLGLVGSHILPAADVTYTLGSPTARWQHIYTGDLHLRNERGDYTLIEESDFLSIRFNKNGKRYKFLLERVPELDEPSR